VIERYELKQKKQLIGGLLGLVAEFVHSRLPSTPETTVGFGIVFLARMRVCVCVCVKRCLFNNVQLYRRRLRSFSNHTIIV